MKKILSILLAGAILAGCVLTGCSDSSSSKSDSSDGNTAKVAAVSYTHLTLPTNSLV